MPIKSGTQPGEVDLTQYKFNKQTSLGNISKQLGVGEGFARSVKQRLFSGQITGATGAPGKLEQEAYNFRTALSTKGKSIGTSRQFFDKDRGVEIYAPSGQYFELFKGGGIKSVVGDVPGSSTGASASSLFTQGTTGTGDQKKAVEGFKEEQLGVQPAEGKEIKRTGLSGFNPKTGADVQVGPDEIFIEYTDGTFEIRKSSALQETGDVKSIEEAGKTVNELRADQGLPPLEEGGDNKVDNTGLEYIGNEYTAENGEKRTAGEDNAFYQDPETRKILERPDTGRDNSLQSTSPSILASRNDTSGMFEAVYGKAPNDEELAYWQSRKDKSGAALIGAMQFAKQQRQTIGAKAGSKATVSADPIEAFNENINEKQLANIGAFSKASNTVDISKASKEQLNKIIDLANKRPEPESLVETYKDEMAKIGFQEDAAELEDADRAVKQLDADFMTQLEQSERTKGLSMRAIRRNQTEFEISYNRIRRDLIVERDYLAQRVANKQTIVNTMVQLTGQDIANAQASYQNQFQNAMSITNLIRGIEQDALTQQQRQQDTARANVQIMSNMLISGNMSYDDLDVNAKSQLANMEMQAGMPVGFTSFISRAVQEPVTSFLPSYVDQNGNRIQPVGTINPNTGAFEIKNINQGKTDFSLAEQAAQKAKTGGGKKATETEIARGARADMAGQLNGVAGSDGYISPEDFKRGRGAWANRGYSTGDYNNNFSYLVNPANPQDYGIGFKTNKKTGVVEVVDYSEGG